METSVNSITQTIIETINTIFSNLFSSIDNNVYSTLDNLAFIDNNITNNSFFSKLFSNNGNTLIVIANSLLFAFILFYAFKLIYSHFVSIDIERPHQIIFKVLIFGICINCSMFIVSYFLDINNFLTEAIQGVGKSITGKEITFSSLIRELNNIISIGGDSFDIFSVDGIIKSFISFGLLNLIFSYALRYVMVKVFILLTPFAIVSLINKSTTWFFKTWFKSFLGLLLMQQLISLIMIVIFSINYSDNLISKFMYIGGIYALTKANGYIKELVRWYFY